MGRWALAPIVAVAALCGTSAAVAADEFTDAVQRAYAPYRAALFKTNSGSPAEAKAAVDAGSAAWAAVARRYAAGAPAPYATDARLPDSLAAVDRQWREAAGLVAAGNTAGAHEALEAIRDTLADLRARNQVVVFSDHMNAYHAVMEETLAIKPADAGALAQATGKQAVLAYLARRLHEAAPPALAADADFRGLLEAVDASVASLGTAVASKDPAALAAALGKLKQPYSKLFLRFG
ncbi:MAG: hypothetical protein AB7P21_25555 [Lautropia sp.]